MTMSPANFSPTSLFTLLLLAGCTDKVATDDSSDSQVDTQPVVAASDYESGSYVSTEFQLVADATQGMDLDGDGDIDNKLPAVLGIVDLVVADDMSVAGLNETITAGIADGSLLLQVDLVHVSAALTSDILLAARDESGALQIDPSSYGTDGAPLTRLEGAFTDQENFTALTDQGQLPFPVLPDAPPLLIPMVQTVLVGTADADACGGMLAGVVPVDAMFDQVVEVVVPSGEDYDPSQFGGSTREDFIASLRETANDPAISDIALPDGARGFSAAVTFQSEALPDG